MRRTMEIGDISPRRIANTRGTTLVAVHVRRTVRSLAVSPLPHPLWRLVRHRQRRDGFFAIWVVSLLVSETVRITPSTDWRWVSRLLGGVSSSGVGCRQRSAPSPAHSGDWGRDVRRQRQQRE